MSGPLRLLFVTDAFPPRSGGSGWSTYSLARGLRARGHDVRIVVGAPALRMIETNYDDFTVWRPVRSVPRVPELLLHRHGIGAGHAVRSLLRAWQPDIVHAQHVLSAQIIAPLVGAVPTVVTVRDHWPVCFYGTHLTDARCPSCLVGTRTPCNVQRGRTNAPAPLKQAKAAVMRRTLALRADVLRGAGAVTAVSRSIADEIAPIIAPERLHVIPNAFDEASIADAALPPHLHLPERFFLYVGKLSPHKGADRIPALMRALPPDTPPLVIAGDGALRGALHATDPNGTRIHLLGEVTNATVLALMARAVALIFPARWAEPLSRTLIEAQMMGCPIVATATGGTPETVIDGETGFLTAPDDVPAMAERLTLLATDNTLRARLSANARRHARAQYALPAVSARVEAVYRAARAEAR